jgi:hypothetical protein
VHACVCVCIRARCLLPAGLNFSGAYLLDGDDRKHERLVMLVELMQDFDIVLLNEVCVCVCVRARMHIPALRGQTHGSLARLC